MKRNAMVAAMLAAGMVCATAPCFRMKMLRADEKSGVPGDAFCEAEDDAEAGRNIPIDEDHFWDEEFRNYISEECDQDKNGFLNEKELNDTKSIYLVGTNVYSLAGIEYFTELEDLDVSFVTLREIDITNNKKLKSLTCYDAKLTSLDLSKNTELEFLDCADNKLTSLDLSKNTKLKSLDCYENLIDELDLRNNTELTSLNCYGNHLKALDLSMNSKLEYLSVGYNPLSSLDVKNCANLKEFWCFDCDLQTIDLSHKKDLYLVSLAQNPLTEFYLYDCPIMSEFLKQNPLQKEVDPSNGKEYLYSDAEFPINGQMTRCFIYFNADAKLIMDKDSATPAPAPIPDPGQVPAPAPSYDFSDFIERLYTVALNRSSDPSGKAFWLAKVRNEGATGADCARGFLIESPEFSNRGLSDDQFIRTLYKTFFDREADDAGYSFWMQKIASGMSRAQVIEGFIDATEWCNLCASYGIKSGAPKAKAEKASANALKFADRLYHECLGRDPEAGGLEFWALRLTNLESSGYEAARDFFGSTEFTNKGVDDATYIKLLYRTFMGRDYDQGGLEFWLGHLSTDMTRLQVLQGFAQSQEFTNICNEYGIDRGTI